MPASLKRLLVSTITVVGGVYLVLSIYLYTRQTDFIFFPQREIMSTPQDEGCAYTDVNIPVGEGQVLHGWWLPAFDETNAVNGTATPSPTVAASANAVSHRTLLYLHGNGGNVGANSEHACRLNRMGFTVLIFDYRGYGQSSGPPRGAFFGDSGFMGNISERTIYADAEATWKYLTAKQQVSPANIVLYGHSLGGAVAIEMAKRHPDAGALIVESTFTSLLDMANQDPVFRFFPVGLVLDQKMESEEKLREIRMPVMVIHGADDSMIPPAMAKRLYEAAAGRKQLFIAPRGDHGDVAATAPHEYPRLITEFLQASPVQ